MPPRGGKERPSARLRVGEDVRMRLAHALARELDDPRLDGVHLTRVEMTPDLSVARVYWRGMPSTHDASATQALSGASGFLRRCLGRSLRLRHVPALEFFRDELVDSGSRMESLLAELTAARALRSRDDDDE
jgi:ribosome-binding factor A